MLKMLCEQRSHSLPPPLTSAPPRYGSRVAGGILLPARSHHPPPILCEAARDPILYEDAVRNLAQGSPVERVYVPASGLATAYGEHQEQLAGALEQLGISQQDYADALAQGGDLEIPIEKYASTVAANKEFAALIADHRRLSPDGFTRQELSDFFKARQDEMQSLLDDIASDKQAETQFEQEAKEIHWAVQQMLVAAGRSAEEARAQAAQATAFFATLAQRSGGKYSPRQLWDMYMPDITGPDGKVYAANEALFPGSEVANRPGEGGTYFSLEEIRAGDAALTRDAEAWGKTVDKFQAKELREDLPIAMLRQTPLVLQMLGAKNLRLNATLHLLRDGMATHGLLPKDLKKLPQAMADPIMVFKSASEGGDLVMMVEVKDPHGGTVVVPIALEQTSTEGYTVNLATSVYGKTNDKTLKPNDRWFTKQIEDGNLLYRNNKKSRDWARRSKLQLPATGTGLSASARGRVHTEADLVKLREANPTMFQPAPAVESDAFKKWSGGADLVDLIDEPYAQFEHGEPVVIKAVHAGDGSLEFFDNKQLGSSSYNPATQLGFFFSSPEVANMFGGIQYPVYVRMKKPYVMSAEEFATMLRGNKKTQSEQIQDIFDAVKNMLDEHDISYTDVSNSHSGLYIGDEGRNITKSLLSDGIIGEKLSEYNDALDDILYADSREEFTQGDRQQFFNLRKQLISDEYDGIIVSGDSEYANFNEILELQHANVITFTPEQIKSIHNRGTFDPKDPRILHQAQDGDKRGSIAFDTPSGRPLVSLFEKADSSTFLHESGHLYLEMLRSLALAENAPAEIATLWEQAKKALGVQGDALTTEQHEQWSASMEAYFMRGEAPSMELRGVFDHFKAWLKAIYNAFRSLGKTPSADLYPVFDRLFATDEQIAEVEAWHEAQKPFAAAMEKMEAEEREAYQKQREKAQESARDAQFRRLSKAYMQAMGGRKGFVKEVRAEVDTMPVYAAMNAAWEKGLDMGLVDGIVGEEARKALGKKRPGIIWKDGGQDPVILAATYGFSSADEMLSAMLNAENKESLVQSRALEREQALRDQLTRGLDADNRETWMGTRDPLVGPLQGGFFAKKTHPNVTRATYRMPCM